MKIAISATGNSMEDAVDPRFGRARGFVVVDTDTDEARFVDNLQNLNAAQGAGIQAAKTVVDSGAEAVLTGHCGPKAFSTLQAANIAVYNGVSGKIGDAVEQFKSGAMKASGGADVEGHWM